MARSTEVEELERLMKSIGAERIVAEFSGGNDEGGVDSITMSFEDPDKDDRDLHDAFYGSANDDVTLDDISKIICSPIYNQYDSFAGDFTCSGTVEFTVGDQELTKTGEESVTSYVDIEWD